MFETKYLTGNLNEQFDELNASNYSGMSADNYDDNPAENFKLLGINFGKKKSSSEDGDFDIDKAAALMNKRRAETKQIQADSGQMDEQGNLIGIRVKPGRVRTAPKPKKPFIDMPSILDTIGGLLNGSASSDAPAWTPEQEAKAKTIGNVTVEASRPLYSKNEKTVFYVIIAILLLVSVYLIASKKK